MGGVGGVEFEVVEENVVMFCCWIGGGGRRCEGDDDVFVGDGIEG